MKNGKKIATTSGFVMKKGNVVANIIMWMAWMLPSRKIYLRHTRMDRVERHPTEDTPSSNQQLS